MFVSNFLFCLIKAKAVDIWDQLHWTIYTLRLIFAPSAHFCHKFTLFWQHVFVPYAQLIAFSPGFGVLSMLYIVSPPYMKSTSFLGMLILPLKKRFPCSSALKYWAFSTKTSDRNISFYYTTKITHSQ
jgi:hypothetical protein